MNSTVRLAALCAAASAAAMATAATAQTASPMSAECVQILNDLNARHDATAKAATMANGGAVPAAPWTAPTPKASGPPTPTPTASGTPTPFGTPSPVVQPLPTPTPTPTRPVITPTPTPTPVVNPPVTTSPGSSGTRYLTTPNGAKTRVVVKDGVTYYVGTYTSGYGHQNLATKKSYDAPTGSSVRMVGGQPIMATSSAKTTGLTSRITSIIDELHLTAAALGLPKPTITSAVEGVHTVNSVHGAGNALDLRCQSKDPCTKWAMTLKQALGPGYDVMWENNPGGGNHLHVEYDGHTA